VNDVLCPDVFGCALEVSEALPVHPEPTFVLGFAGKKLRVRQRVIELGDNPYLGIRLVR
jgi:hypothetical protein